MLINKATQYLKRLFLFKKTHLLKVVYILFLFNTNVLHVTQLIDTTMAEVLQGNPNSTQKVGKIRLAISLIWEGEYIKEYNIQAIRDFRKQFSQINLLQFLNPAYFTKKGVDTDRLKNLINSTVGANDIIGLHLHGWKSLIEASGVKFRVSPTFWGNTVQIDQCQPDCGHEVPLSIYSEEEIDRIMTFSLDLLNKYGYKRPRSFMAGGWMASHNVLESVAKHGITHDFSAVPPEIVKNQLKHYPLHKWIKSLWGNYNSLSQPSLYYTKSGWINEMGNNAATLEYKQENSFIDLFKAYSQLLKESPTQDYFLHLGFYQETASQNLPRLASSLQKIFAYSSEKGVPISIFSRLSQDEFQPQTSKVYERSHGFRNQRERRVSL